MSVITQGTETKENVDYPSRFNMEIQVVKLKTNNVNVANFCFFIQKTGHKKQTLSNEGVIDSLQRVGEGYEYERAINKIYVSYDTYFMMNIARFDGPDGGLHCCDESDKKDVDKVDDRCLPVFRRGPEMSKIRGLEYRGV